MNGAILDGFVISPWPLTPMNARLNGAVRENEYLSLTFFLEANGCLLLIDEAKEYNS